MKSERVADDAVADKVARLADVRHVAELGGQLELDPSLRRAVNQFLGRRQVNGERLFAEYRNAVVEQF